MSESRTKFRIYVLISLAVIISIVYGAVNFVNLLNERFDNKNLEIITQQTAESEGYCLTELAQEYSLSFNNIAQLYKDACVSIEVSSSAGKWLGSGVCVASKGYKLSDEEVIESGSYIVTNHHVIRDYYDYENVSVSVYPNDYNSIERYGYEISYDAEVLWSDSYLDIGIIYTKENIDWVLMKDRFINPKQEDLIAYSERAFVIGTPQSLSYQNTITKGYAYSELSHSYTVEKLMFEEVVSNIYEDIVPMKISIMGGNSGGGLFDSQGYLIGVPTLGTSKSQSREAINYAVPIYPIELVLDYVVFQNETENEIEICSLNDLDFVLIDSKESETMISQFSGNVIYYYGGIYSRQNLTFSENGLKIIDSNEDLIEKGDVIQAAVVNEERFEFIDRNDLIYFLLTKRKGDTIGFEVKDSDIIEVVI